MAYTKKVAGFAGALLVAYAAWLWSGRPNGYGREAINDVWFTVLPLLAAVATAMTARATQGRERNAWTALTVGVAGWAVGSAFWSYYELIVDRYPFPSPADIGYLMLPIFAGAALLLFPVGRSYSRAQVFFDGVIVAGSLFFINWVTFLDGVVADSDQSRLATLVSLAYPVLDVAVLTLAATVLAKQQVRQRGAVTLLALGVACLAVADSFFCYLNAQGLYKTGNPIDIAWAAGFLVIGVAAAAGRDSRERPVTTPAARGFTTFWLPYAPLLAAAIVAIAELREVLKSAVVSAIGGVLAFALVGRQIVAMVEHRRFLAALERARRDPLTGVANRMTLHERLDSALKLPDRGPVAVIALDLNDFKLINDSFGNQAGDELLIGVAKKLTAQVDPDTVVARLTGDHFVVLVEGVHESPNAVAERVLAAFDEPFMAGDSELVMFPSVGLAVALPAESEVSGEEMLRRADIAIAAARRSRTGGVQTFTPQMNRSAARWDPLASPDRSGRVQLALLSELRQGITRSELTLLYQPQMDLTTSRMVSVEALLRWNNPRRGLLGPDEFLPLVRRYGLMGAVNDLVVKQALDDVLKWRAADVDLSVAVNLFAPTMADPALPGAIMEALANRGLEPSVLKIEITEHLPLDDLEGTRSVLQRLRQDGIKVALDDFGSGYSTLSQLRDLPIDEVKLDRGFVSPITSDESAAAVVRAVVGFIHALGLRAVGEGVEDPETESRLREFGCDLAQGYLFRKPLTCQELLDMAASRRDIADVVSSAGSPARQTN